MIKICSLDFLNREEFGTDVMTADGSILFHSEDKVTPEIILRLYFQEVYVEEAFFKEESKVAVKNVEAGVAAVSTNLEPASNLKVHEDIDEKTVFGGPRVIEPDTEVNEEIDLSGPRHVEIREKEEEEENQSSGPRHIETREKEEEENQSSGPRHVDMGAVGDSKQEKKHFYSTENFAENTEAKVSSVNPEEEQLVFDEKQAKRIVEYSLKIGKMLKFSDNELKELEQVAYYCNIGIDNFKKSDMSKKGFRKMKAFASYEKLVNEGVVSEEIAEMVKFCANSYESDALPLNSKTPYHHIVALVSFYEELLSQNNSKEATLLKILQIGGNQFNIFILHKFIKMMREANG